MIVGLWDEKDGFYYDQVVHDGETQVLRIRSLVGLLPLVGATVLDSTQVSTVAGIKEKLSQIVARGPGNGVSVPWHVAQRQILQYYKYCSITTRVQQWGCMCCLSYCIVNSILIIDRPLRNQAPRYQVCQVTSAQYCILSRAVLAGPGVAAGDTLPLPLRATNPCYTTVSFIVSQLHT